jgi:transcriptional regulator with XRE-family HTH domain
MNTPDWKHSRPTKKLIAQQLRTIVERHGLTQATIAKTIRCSPGSVSVALRGKFGSLELYDCIAWALGMSLSDLDLSARGVTSIHRARKSA